MRWLIDAALFSKGRTNRGDAPHRNPAISSRRTRERGRHDRITLSVIRPWCDVLTQRFLQKSQPFDRDLVARRLDLSPDGGSSSDDFDVSGEGFDDYVALIAYL